MTKDQSDDEPEVVRLEKGDKQGGFENVWHSDESRDLLEQLWIQASFGEYQCRWKWQVGDVAFWDNRSTQHYAISDYFPNRRVMERITVVGDRPF